jgi:triosephosphate isomerase
MKQRSKLLFGNWKMNFTVAQASAFAKKLAAKPIPKGVTVAIFPHSLALSDIATTVHRTGPQGRCSKCILPRRRSVYR